MIVFGIRQRASSLAGSCLGVQHPRECTIVLGVLTGHGRSMHTDVQTRLIVLRYHQCTAAGFRHLSTRTERDTFGPLEVPADK